MNAFFHEKEQVLLSRVRNSLSSLEDFIVKLQSLRSQNVILIRQNDVLREELAAANQKIADFTAENTKLRTEQVSTTSEFQKKLNRLQKKISVLEWQ